MTLDKIIADEILNTLDERIEQYSENTKRHHFSLAYKIQRSRIIKNANKPAKRSYRYPLRRVKYALIAVALAVPLLTGFSVWKIYGNYTFNVRHDHSVLYFEELPDSKTLIENVYRLSPDTGYSWSTRQNTEDTIISIYTNGNKKITLNQLANISDKRGPNINTQFGMPEEIMIDEYKGIYTPMSRGNNHIMWFMNGYVFTLSGIYSKNELIDLAKSVEIENDKIDYFKPIIEKIHSHKSTFEKYYELEIDNDWDISNRENSTQTVTTSYTQDDKFISFSQHIIYNHNNKINTENALVMPATIFEENDGFIIEFFKGEYDIWWIYDGYLFNISSNLDKEEVIELAKCTKIKK